METVIFYTNSDTTGAFWGNGLAEGGHPTRRAADLSTLHLEAEQGGKLVLLHAQAFQAGLPENVKALSSKIKVFVLSDLPDVKEGERLLASGAVGYGNAKMHPSVLNQAVEVIESGNAWLYPELMHHLISRAADHPDEEERERRLTPLSPREKEIALLVAQGMSNHQIGEALQITERTVKAHMGATFAKLGVKDRLGLALLVKGA